MRYLTSILVGIGAALATALLWVLVAFVGPIAMIFLVARTTGSGGIGAVTTGSGSILVAALVGFVAGYAWHRRRASRGRAHVR